MSSSAITGSSEIAHAPLNLTIAGIQASGKLEAAAKPAASAATSNGTQPILLVPTKPPLSAAVMAELIGQQTSSYGSSIGDYASEQKPGQEPPAAGIDSPSLS